MAAHDPVERVLSIRGMRRLRPRQVGSQRHRPRWLPGTRQRSRTRQAGIVMGLEVSRLARNSADWHRLLELCALAATLILDEDTTQPASTTGCCSGSKAR